MIQCILIVETVVTVETVVILRQYKLTVEGHYPQIGEKFVGKKKWILEQGDQQPPQF